MQLMQKEYFAKEKARDDYLHSDVVCRRLMRLGFHDVKRYIAFIIIMTYICDLFYGQLHRSFSITVYNL
jgi:hypothetical protein